MKIIAPEDVKDNKRVDVEMVVTPMEEEVPYGDDFNQKFTFEFSTTCAGVDCVFLEMVNPEPQTLVIYVILAFCLLFAVFRRGQLNAQTGDDNYNLAKQILPITRYYVSSEALSQLRLLVAVLYY